MRASSILFLLLLSVPAVAQPSLLQGSFDPNVPTPSAILGYELGERFTDYRLLEAYTSAVAASSPRVKVVQYGTTPEHRPLRVFIVTSPRNHERLEDIQSKNLQLTDPRSLTARDAEEIKRDIPAIVWFSFGVHGNESSSPEAAMEILYRLAAGTDQGVQRLLDGLVVLIDPSLNPDGRERYVQWANSSAQSPPNSDPFAYEHSELWPGGRTNHYYFDLNRDWSWLTQTESRDRLTLYRTWMPHTHVDFHEMGYESSYFFFPASKPFHVTLPPEVQEWGTIYGKGNARALDSIGSSYYTGERFDIFYPGYGDSWPTFNGGIGMTYEQAGSGQAGLSIRRSDNSTLKLIDRIRNHVTTGMATLETTRLYREKRIADFASFWRTSVDEYKNAGFIAIPGDQDPSLLYRMSDILMRQGIEVHRLSRPEKMSARSFYGPKTESMRLPEGSLVVSLSQPRARLAIALLEPKTSVKDTFFYDVSAWSLPVAFGLKAYEVKGTMPAGVALLTEPPPPSGGIIGPEKPIAYLIPWTRQSAATVSVQLLRMNTVMRVAHRSFTTEGREYGAGTIVILPSQNKPDLLQKLSELSVRHGVDVVGVSSAWTEKGVSLGSDHVRPVRLPSIGVFTGPGVSANSYGELWYLFEQELRLPFAPLTTDRLKRSELDRYDVLILPDGYGWRAALDSAAISMVRSWVTRGGVLLALEAAARTLTTSTTGLTPAILVGEEKKDDKEKDKADPALVRKELFKTLSSFEKAEYDRLNRIPGSIFVVDVDTTHPVGFGASGQLFVLKGNGAPFTLSSQGHTIARYSADTLSASGYAPMQRAKQAAGQAYVQEHTIGRGKVLLFSESMTFRMFWRGPARLLVNGILFVHTPVAR